MTNVLCSDLSRAFPKGEIAQYFRQDWLTAMARDARSNKDFSQRTHDVGRWAREHIKRQSGGWSSLSYPSSVPKFVPRQFLGQFPVQTTAPAVAWRTQPSVVV
jgi:hypothetical protein